jgi:hypothetical protein
MLLTLDLSARAPVEVLLLTASVAPGLCGSTPVLCSILLARLPVLSMLLGLSERALHSPGEKLHLLLRGALVEAGCTGRGYHHCTLPWHESSSGNGFLPSTSRHLQSAFSHLVEFTIMI